MAVARHPLAFGITKWGPLPGTADMHIMWDGPGSPLYLHATDPERSQVPGRRIEHPAACSTYQTVRAADRAVQALAAALGEETA
jgi:hypothetical protein